MFSFLVPGALAGLLLLSIPIVLHIFKPRKVRQTPFSSLRWLHASQHRLSRRIKWHQVLLFLLRTAFIVLLVLALAKPMWTGSDDAAVAERIVVVDMSRSMTYQPEGMDAPIDRARNVADQIVSHVNAGDRTTLVLAGNDVEAVGPMVNDAGMYLPRLRAMQPQLGEVSLTSALQQVRPLIGTPREGALIDLYFITDDHAQNWSQGDISRFMEEGDETIRVNVIDVGPEVGENAWIAAAKLIELQSPARRLVSVQVRTVGPEAQTRTVRLSGLAGLQELTEKIDIEPGRLAQVVFEIPVSYDMTGQVARIELDPADALPSDDVRWLNLDATGATRVLVIEAESTQIPEQQSGFHLRTALDVLASESQGMLDVTRRLPTEVLSTEINESDVIVLVDVATLPEGNLTALEERVQAGAGLMVFVGPSVDDNFYNTQLHNALQPSRSLLPVRLGAKKLTPADEPVTGRLTQVDWSHPLLSNLYDPIYGDLSKTQFDVYFDVQMPDAVPGAADAPRVIATIGDDAPAIIERNVGAGKVLLFNTTANDAWSNLPRLRSFLPLLDRAMNYLTGGLRRGTFTVGEVVTVPLPRGATTASLNATVTTPSDESLSPAVQSVGGRPMLRLTGLNEAGVYRVTYSDASGQQSFPFVLQPAADDSLMARVDELALESWWQGATFRILRPDERDMIDMPDTRMMLEPVLVLLACLALLAEMFFVHWLCPRMNPAAVTHSTVAQHGFFEHDKPDDPVVASRGMNAGVPRKREEASTATT